MNISSAVVLLENNKKKEVKNLLLNINGCEVHLMQDDKLIVTIEAENIESETAIMKQIESVPGVLSAYLAFAYSEDELDREMKNVEGSDDFPEWLNIDDINTKNIPYSGKLKM